jgi:hypothetical protein
LCWPTSIYLFIMHTTGMLQLRSGSSSSSSITANSSAYVNELAVGDSHHFTINTLSFCQMVKWCSGVASCALNNKNLIANCKLYINAENYTVFCCTFSILLTDVSVILRIYNLSVAVPHNQLFGRLSSCGFPIYILSYHVINTKSLGQDFLQSATCYLYLKWPDLKLNVSTVKPSLD